MAFMMPLVKQNYSLYNTPGSHCHQPASGPVPVPVSKGQQYHHRRIRKNSDQSDQRSAAGNQKVVLKRNAKSEGVSLSTSPAGFSNQDTGGQRSVSKPMEIRRGRWSFQFLSPQSSVRRRLGKEVKASSVPTNLTKSPPPARGKPIFSPSSRSSFSSESSSDSEHGNGGLHSRLMRRLRKTLGFGDKEGRPTSS